MDMAATHRTRAAEERAKAAATPLPNRRAMYVRSAEMWDEMARAVEDNAERSSVNAAAKAAG